MPGRDWQNLVTTDFAGLDPERTVALLPLAATEQHGPHLPLSTDRVIVDGVVGAACADLPDDLTVLVLPTQAVGESLEHRDFRGTLTLRAETLIGAWCEIGAGVARSGVRKLALVNSHGGQPQIVDIVALRLRADHGMLVARVNTYALGVPEGLFGDDERAFGYHAGAVETALMRHLAPALVRDEAVAFFPSAARTIAARHERLGAEGMRGERAGLGWMAQDLNPAGAMGDARAGDAARGAAVLAHMAERLRGALIDLGRFPLAELKPGPNPS